MTLEKLSALKVKRAATPGLYGDGRGLYLRVGGGNAKSWVLRYMLCGVAHSMGLGAVAGARLPCRNTSKFDRYAKNARGHPSRSRRDIRPMSIV